MRLLIIEDYAPLRDSLSRGLRDVGYAVDATGSGGDGLWYAANHLYDVVILDVMLPGIDGFELLRRLRGGGNTTHVLVLTARDAVADRVTGLDLGADDYVVKPFAFDELLAMARQRYDRVDPVIPCARWSRTAGGPAPRLPRSAGSRCATSCPRTRSRSPIATSCAW